MARTRAFEKVGKNYRYFLSVIIMLPLLAASVWAQVTASIVGKVKDASGAVVPGATVTAKHLESGLTRTAETDSNGSYSIPSLPIGQYELNTEKTGFKQEVRRGRRYDPIGVVLFL